MLQGFFLVSMYQPKFSLSQKIQKIVLLIYYCQILTLAFPIDGWNLWTYKDGALRMTKNLLNMILIFPYIIEIKSSVLIYVLIILFSIINIFILLAIFIIAKFKNKLSLMLTITYWYLLFIPNLFFIPQLYIFIGSLSFTQRALLYSNFQYNVIISIIILSSLVLIFLCLFSIYFIRKQRLEKESVLVQKFCSLGLLRQFFTIAIIFLHFQNRNLFINTNQLLLMHFFFLTLIFEAVFFETMHPQILKFVMISVTTCISCLLIISTNVISQNTQIHEEQLLVIQLITATLLSSICNLFHNKIFIKRLLQGNQTQYTITCVEWLFHISTTFTQSKRISLNILFYVLFTQYHKQKCISCFKKAFKDEKLLSKSMIFYFLDCLLKNGLFRSKNTLNSYQELLQIYNMDFQNKIKKQPLTAYIEFKQFTLKKEKISQYLRGTIKFIYAELEEIIQNRNSILGKTNSIKYEENYLQVKTFIQTYQIEDLILPKIIELIDLKMDIWNKQINGLETIDDLEQLIINYSSKIVICQDSLQQKLQINLMNQNQISKSRNVIELRIASIFNLIILNNYQISLQCEQQISEILLMENSLPNDLIRNIDIIQDNLCLIMVSMVQNRGFIKNNKKQQIANYFGLDINELESINHINLFIPQFISELHEQFLQSYLETAQSPLFNQYQIVFSKQKNEFIQAQQLKLENNFDFFDDYVVTGCLSKVKETSEFILFDENGKILSVTQGFYTDIIQQSFQEELSAQTINQAYIFLFFTNIFSILESQKDNINQSEFLQVELMTVITIFENLSKIIQFFIDNKTIPQNSMASQFGKIVQKTANLSNSKTYTTKKQQKENLSTGRYFINKSFKLSDDIQLLCPTFRTQVLDFMQQYNQFQSVQYLTKISLQYRTIGKKPQSRSYFIIEILDFRKKGNSPHLLKNNKFISQDINQFFGENQNNKHYLSQNQSQSPLQQGFQHYNKEGNNLFGFKKQNFSKSFSDNDQQFRNKNLLSQQNDMSFLNRKENQTQSSQSSSILRMQNLNFLRFIQYSSKMNNTLKIILILTIISLIIISAVILFNILIIRLQISEQINSNYSLNAPLLFNRYFFQSYALSWTLLMNGLKIISQSDFLINQTFYYLKNMEKETFSNLSKMYPNFLEIENMGLLPNISLKLLGIERQTVSYTEFITFIQNALQYLFQFQSIIKENIQKTLDLDFVNSIVTLRYNLKYVFDMNKELIGSLDQMNYNQIQNQYQQFLIIIQLFFWKKIEQQKCQILKIIGKFSESKANNLILQHQIYKQILQQSNNQKSYWKNQNFTQIYRKNICKREKIIVQNTKSKQNQNKTIGMLNARIKKSSSSNKKYLFYYLIILSTLMSFLFGGYYYYIFLIQNYQPQQQLALNFIRFSSYFDTLITTAIVIKTQPQVYPGIVSNQIYTQNQMNQYRDPFKQLFYMFLNVYETFDDNLTQIYEGILFTNKIDDSNRKILLDLYQNNICKVISNQIPFCQLEQLGDKKFTEKYQKFYQIDNNQIYLRNGIIGIINSASQFMKTNYDYEIASINYVTDFDQLNRLYLTSEFNNILIQHFSSTTQCTEKFLDIILSANEESMSQNQYKITLYFCLIGLGLLIVLGIFFAWLINLTCMRFIYLKLSLSMVPKEILADQITISQKKLLD
ncbi:unnamed protein product [Paramecium sonneborni]|uniref:Transmembrane protein n=1 Tax=Paramecium sonneborni TaxID=65129 RepID=A0A8S1RLJ1_9CILI|nr:unnamed protein product [Paramecium sonneborni]